LAAAQKALRGLEASGGNTDLAELERAKEQLRRDFAEKHSALMAQFQRLQQEHERLLAELENKADMLRRAKGVQARPRVPARSDRLDQIFHRRDQIEQRLNRLERSKAPQAPAPK